MGVRYGDVPGVDDDVAGVMGVVALGIVAGVLSGLSITALAGHATERFAVIAFGSPYVCPTGLMRLANGTALPLRRQS